ncbi:MAG: translocation/assembly module TamB domain-containing protein [Candidatus Saccharicenans sp.]
MNFLKKRKAWLIIFLLLVFLYAGFYLAKGFFLKELSKKLNQNFEISGLKLTTLPPRLIVYNLKLKSENPEFSADRLEIELPFFSIFKKEKPVTVQVEHPVFIYTSKKNKGKSAPASPLDLSIKLPFVIASGYVRNGSFSIDSAEGFYDLQQVSAFFGLNLSRLNLFLKSGQAKIRPFSSAESLEGELEAVITSRGRTINFNRVIIQGQNSAVRVEGKWLRQKNPQVDLKANFNLSTKLIMSSFDLPFEWEGKTSGEAFITNEGGHLKVKVDYVTKDFRFNQVYLGTAEGQVEVEKDRGGQVVAEIKNPPKPVEKVIINFGGGRVSGQISGFHLDSIMKYVSVPWPVASPAWGSFTLYNGLLDVSAEFRDRIGSQPVNGRQTFNGQVQLNYDLSSKELKIQAKELRTSFGQLDLKGQMEIGKLIDLNISGQVNDVKGAREFTEKILKTTFSFPEIRGAGRANIAIKGDYNHPDLNFEFSCSPAGFERINVTTARGEVSVKAGLVTGKAYVVDKNIQGEIDLKADQNTVDTKISLERGTVEAILSILGINFPLRGTASGNFNYLIFKNKSTVDGEFKANELFLVGAKIEKVEGQLIWDGESLSFPRLDFNLNGGRLSGRLALGLLNNGYDFDLKATQVNLKPFSESFSGLMDLNLKGKGIFGRSQPQGKFSIEGFGLYFLKAASSTGEYSLNFLNNNLSLDIKGELFPDHNNYEVKIAIPFDRDLISGEVKGQLNSLDFLLPWKGAAATVNFLLSFQGPVASLGLTGAIEIKGSVLPIPGFAHALTDFSGLAFINNRQVSIRSFQGFLGGGPVQGSGELNFGDQGLDKAEIQLEGKNMQLSVFERTREVADGNLRFIKQGPKTVFEGDLNLKEVVWKKEFWDKLSFSSQAYSSGSQKNWINDLNLNLRLRASDNVWVENSMGRIRARMDLIISGTVANPAITGEIDVLSGTVYFQDRDFNVIRGRLSFFNPLVIDPYLDLQGETYVKDYHVLFNLTGLVSNLKPEFSSSPPLPPEQIMSLLALGESYQERYSFDTIQMSTASLISYQLAKKSESLLSLDRFRLDPFILGSTSEITARLTVGKSISRNFSILYSTNLATQREEIVRLEWDLSGGFSLVAIRDELGRVSFDLRLRKRF